MWANLTGLQAWQVQAAQVRAAWMCCLRRLLSATLQRLDQSWDQSWDKESGKLQWRRTLCCTPARLVL